MLLAPAVCRFSLRHPLILLFIDGRFLVLAAPRPPIAVMTVKSNMAKKLERKAIKEAKKLEEKPKKTAESERYKKKLRSAGKLEGSLRFASFYVESG